MEASTCRTSIRSCGERFSSSARHSGKRASNSASPRCVWIVERTPRRPKQVAATSREAEPATVSPIILKSARRSRQSMSTASATVSVARASR